MKKNLLIPVWSIIVLCFTFTANAQNVKKIYLNPIEKSLGEVLSFGTPQIKSNEFKIYQIDFNSLKNQLEGVGHVNDNLSGFIAAIRIPLEDGTMHEFLSKENNTMARELAAEFTEIKAFDGIGSSNGENANWDITPHGFHAMIHIPGKGTTFIDPIIKGNTEYYIVYNRKDFTSEKVMECGLIDDPGTQTSNIVKSFGNCDKRTYRLALAATGEYTTFHGGTVPLALAAQVTTMNRVNQVFGRDLAIQMTIIANNNLIIYTNSGTDPYTNNNGATMLNQNQTTCTSVIGSANYDIGHVFSTGGGGIAQLQSPCNASGKARGVTGSSAPIGDPFDIDYVAHEMGHQFGANHTFNNNSSGSCSGNANTGTSYEPGSGATIMAYAGICTATFNVQNNSDDYFHTISMQEMGAFITNAGSGGSCPVITPLSNISPSVTPVNTVSVPQGTPFFLTANATDPDPGDVLTYCWEEMDAGISTTTPTATQTTKANFRSFDPTTNPTRYFPNLASLATNGPFTWEVLPTVSRTMNFRVTVRDNAVGGGCNDEANTTVSVIASAGPFNVTYPNNTGITWVGATTQTVTWTVAGTTAAPISCANVDILLSTDGGLTYPTVLVSNTPNDGSQLINVPNLPSTTCRVMVVCNGGNFFDVSNNNFTITAATNDYTLNTTPTTISICQGSNAVYTVNTGSIGGYSSNITLSITGVPAGATSNFSVNPVVPGNSSTLTISNTAGVTPGSYNLTVTANSASGVKTNNLTLIVSSGTPGTVTLSAPANGATGVAIPANFTWSTAAGSGVTYDIQIATDPGISSIVDQATGLSTTSFSSGLLSNSTTYYWRVRSVTGCGTSAWSTIFSFTTGTCSTTVSPNVPVAISGSGTPTITSTINIPSSIIIADVNLADIIGTHTYVSDLTVTLTSPSATTVTLWSGICGTNDDFNLNFDDAAAAGAIPCPPTGGGTFQPVNALSVFNGEDAQGIWTLTIADGFNIDGGSLNNWAIEICGVSCVPPATPTISAGSATTFCSGGSVTLTASSATGNQWSLNGTPIGGATNQTYAATTAGDYTVVSTVGCPSSTSLATTVTVNPIPATPTISAGSATTFCSGGSVLLSSSAASGNQWSLNGTPIGGATAQTYSATTSGNYSVIATASGCPSLASAATAVTVNPTPVITTGTVTNPSACATSTGSIQVNGSATGVVSWTGAASGSSGSVTLPYVITGLAAGTYNITLVNSCTSNTLVQGLTDPSAPSTPTVSAGSATTFCAGGSVTLTSSSATGNQWSLNGTPIGGATTQTYAASAAGDYTVVVISGGCTSAASSATTVTVNSIPTTPIISAGSATTFCSGGSVTLTSSSATGNQWSLNGSPIGGATAQTYVASAAGNYAVVVTSSCPSAASASTVVTVDPTPATPAISAGSATTFCSGGSVTLTSSSATGNQWSLNGSPIGGATAQTYVASTAGNYTVVVTSACPSAASAATTVTINSLPTVTFSPLSTLCVYNGPSTLAGGSPTTGTYSGIGVSGGQFDPSTAGLGTHTLTYTFIDGNGCSNSATSDIIVDACASIDELADGIINVYPNPTFGSVNIISDSNPIENVNVFDATGRLVYQLKNNNTNSVSIDLIEFAKGVYNFEIKIGESIRRERIVKN